MAAGRAPERVVASHKGQFYPRQVRVSYPQPAEGSAGGPGGSREPETELRRQIANHHQSIPAVGCYAALRSIVLIVGAPYGLPTRFKHPAAASWAAISRSERLRA